MKPIHSIIPAIALLIITSLACSTLTGGSGSDPSETGVIPGQESNGTQYAPGYEPGWKIFSNANYVNGIAIHEGTLWAATEGGVVAWDLANDQPAKFTPLDGLGQLSTYDVVVCPMPETKVVVATEKGLSLYDIASGTWDASPITPEDSHVSTNKVTKLFCDEQNGRLVIVYRGVGILDINNGSFKQYLEDDGLAWNSPDSITTTGSDIWAGGYKGISVISASGIQAFNEESGMLDDTANALETTSDGTVWVATDGGLVHFVNGSQTAYTSDTVDGIPGSLEAVTASSDSTLWISSSSSRICQFDPAQEACIYTYEGSTDYFLNDMIAGNSGDVYYSTYGGGIWAYNGNEWRNLFIEEDQLVGNFVDGFVEDQNGMMWVATDKGVQRFDPNNMEAAWETFKAGEDGPSTNWSQGIFVDPTGKIWFANDSKYASTYDGSSWSHFGTDDGIPGSVNAIAVDANNVPYIGTSEGLFIMDGSQKIITDADGLPGKVVRSLLADGNIIWIGTTDGLARLQDGAIEVVLDASSEGLPEDNISAIRKTADGYLILGTTGGLAQYDGSQVTTLLEPQSISGLFGESVNSVSDISISPDGSLWVSTYAGLYHGNGQKWEHFTTADGLPTNNINTVFVNSAGVVWVGGGYTRSGGGIARFIPGEIISINTGDQEPGQAGTGDSVNPPSSIQYDENTSMPLYPDAEQVYSTDSVLNYWSNTNFVTLRDFYLTEMPNIGWLLDLDENGNCRDDNRCMGWHGGYDDPENQTFFFLKGDKGYITLNLIPEGSQINIIFSINEPE